MAVMTPPPRHVFSGAIGTHPPSPHGSALGHLSVQHHVGHGEPASPELDDLTQVARLWHRARQTTRLRPVTVPNQVSPGQPGRTT